MDPWTDPRTTQLRAALLRPLATFIDAATSHLATPRVLDFGCGDLLLATLLDQRSEITGWDLSPAAREHAQRTAAGLPGRRTVIEAMSDAEPHHYDIIVASSVVQYLASEDELRDLIAELAPLLRTSEEHAGAELPAVILTDVVDPPRRRWREATDLLRFLASEVGPLAACDGLRRSASRSPGQLLALPTSSVADAAEHTGLSVRQLPHNLTAFSSRRTYVLTIRRPT